MSVSPIKVGDEVRVSTNVYSCLNSTRVVALSDVMGQRFDANGVPVGGVLRESGPALCLRPARPRSAPTRPISW
jgi:hypothetical protein